jgi:hypothetical protein
MGLGLGLEMEMEMGLEMEMEMGKRLLNPDPQNSYRQAVKN